jgi:hypothetical protein
MKGLVKSSPHDILYNKAFLFSDLQIAKCIENTYSKAQLACSCKRWFFRLKLSTASDVPASFL